ncbi:hypothetical protein [Pseudomonas sp. Marseille-QA0332]
MNRDDLVMPDHPVYLQAKEAHREYLEAQERGDPPEEVARLRAICEAQFKAANDYGLHKAGVHTVTTH